MKDAGEIGADLIREADQIMGLDPSPTEALYKWIDQTIRKPTDRLQGCEDHRIDAVPVFLDLKTRRCYVTTVPLVGRLLRHLARPVLCSLAKYDTETGEFIEAIPLNAWPNEWRETLSVAIREAFARADSD